MNISIVKEKSTYIATVTFDAQEWKNAQEKAYANLAQNVTVQGFRKGKAPLELAKRHIDGRKMVEKAVDVLLPLGNQKVLEENNFELLVRPELDVKEVSDDKVVVEYYYVTRPEVTLGQYKDLEIAKDSVEVTDEDVENELKALQQKNVELQVKEGEIALGDTANIDFKGFVNGVAFEGGEAKGYDLEIGSGAFIPGFEEQLVGAKAGQDLDINVTFPEQYSKELAGKPAVFKIHVNSVKEKVVPEINDDLALDANIEGVSNLEELKEAFGNNYSDIEDESQQLNISDVVIVDYIVDQFRRKNYFVSFLIYFLISENVFDLVSTKNSVMSELNLRKLCKVMNEITDSRLYYFSEECELPLEDVLKAAEYIRLVPQGSMKKKILQALENLKHSALVESLLGGRSC